MATDEAQIRLDEQGLDRFSDNPDSCLPKRRRVFACSASVARRSSRSPRKTRNNATRWRDILVPCFQPGNITDKSVVVLAVAARHGHQCPDVH